MKCNFSLLHRFCNSEFGWHIISEKIFVCESETLESLDASNFNVFDIDEESFATWWTNYRISGGRNVFGLVPRPKTSNYISPFQIISGERYPLDKNDVGDYDVEISVIDSSGLSDTNSTNITVIEINNIPTTHSGLGLETIYMSGANSVFLISFLWMMKKMVFRMMGICF